MNVDLLAMLARFFDRDVNGMLVEVADILIVTLFVYRVLLLVRGTRAGQMGIGLAALFATYQAAVWLNLNTLRYLLENVITYLVLIVVVIFQHDIRRALMRVGRHPFFRPGGAQDTHVIEEVIKSVTALAQKRVGALIVFERDASLDEFVEPGTELDASVTRELLFSIFIPSFQNPMHDGAVIIRDGRVAQAGAFLPLPAGTKLDRMFGTRHRAAIGITEETDAVAIVVSEERGAVSLCHHGNIVRDLDTTSLREALVGLFHRRQEATQKDVQKRESRDSEARARLETRATEPHGKLDDAVEPDLDDEVTRESPKVEPAGSAQVKE